MRLLRVWILLLLVALLPLRGTLAATLMCHEGAPAGQAEAIEHMHEHAMSAVADPHHGDTGSTGKCSVCSGLTSPAAPFEAASPLAAAPARSQLVPQPTLWPASFVAARLKRPPRSL